MNWRLAQYVFLPLLFVLTSQAQAAIPQAERDALLALYAMTDGDNWINNAGWNDAPDTECSWYGVSCDAGQTTVTGLGLQANNLKGKLPAELINLTRLTSSDFRYNGVYSDSQTLLDFLDATGPVGSLLDTQTLDAVNVSINNIAETSFNVNWDAVAYGQAGGYRIYLAYQIEDGVNLPYLSDFVEISDINNKGVTSYSPGDLTPCTQYFVKVTSYTASHEGNATEVESDGKQFNLHGTIPNWSAGCNLNIYSIANVTLNVSYNSEITEKTIAIERDPSGNMIYTFAYPGEAPVDNLNACNINNNGVIINDQVSVNGEQITCVDNTGSIELGQNTQATVEMVFEIPNVYIMETAQVGTVVNRLTGYLPGSENISYIITTGNPADMFAIESINNEGVITVNGVLEYDRQSKYLLEIEIENELLESFTIPMQITILPVTSEIAGQPGQNEAAGCTLHTGAPFDPIWLLILILAGFHRIGRAA